MTSCSIYGQCFVLRWANVILCFWEVFFPQPTEIKERKQSWKSHRGYIVQKRRISAFKSSAPCGAVPFPLLLFTLKIIYISFLSNRHHFVKLHLLFLSPSGSHNTFKTFRQLYNSFWKLWHVLCLMLSWSPFPLNLTDASLSTTALWKIFKRVDICFF